VGRDDGFSVRSVIVLRMRASRRVFVKGMYTEDEDVKEGEDAGGQSTEPRLVPYHEKVWGKREGRRENPLDEYI
jgi:hypothetical protein